ncbi:MAG: hypothetical protein WCE68_08205 [Anaerolineales bacterium]
MGAPKGNTNALKHGLYAKHFSPEEQAGLRKMSPEDYRHEINMMRVAVNNVFDMQMRVYQMLDSAMKSSQPVEVEALTRISNSLALGMTALSTVARTHALFNGTDKLLNDDFEVALKSLPIFLEDTYLTETNEGMGEEILVNDE